MSCHCQRKECGMWNPFAPILSFPDEWSDVGPIPKFSDIRFALNKFKATVLDHNTFVSYTHILLHFNDKAKSKSNQAYIAKYVFEIVKVNLRFCHKHEKFGAAVINKLLELKKKGEEGCSYNKEIYSKYGDLIPLIRKDPVVPPIIKKKKKLNLIKLIFKKIF